MKHRTDVFPRRLILFVLHSSIILSQNFEPINGPHFELESIEYAYFIGFDKFRKKSRRRSNRVQHASRFVFFHQDDDFSKPL